MPPRDVTGRFKIPPSSEEAPVQHEHCLHEHWRGSIDAQFAGVFACIAELESQVGELKKRAASGVHMQVRLRTAWQTITIIGGAIVVLITLFMSLSNYVTQRRDRDDRVPAVRYAPDHAAGVPRVPAPPHAAPLPRDARP